MKFVYQGQIRIDQIAVAAAEDGPDTILALANGHLFKYRVGNSERPEGWHELTLEVFRDVDNKNPCRIEFHAVSDCAADIISILEETRAQESNSPFTVEEAISRIKSKYHIT